MDKAVLKRDFWAGRNVFLTGHTGFKGAWTISVLRALGANVHGYSLAPPTCPSAFELLNLERSCSHVLGDVRDGSALRQAIRAANPEIIIHMAAQSLVHVSYDDPVSTFDVNVMGTVYVLDACRGLDSLISVIIVTTDKCYENTGWVWGYRENDRLGGHDPYSSSKAAAELAIDTYRRCFFVDGEARIASVRAGNVIGGGDFSQDRLIPDAMRAFMAGRTLRVRNPLSIRPWQHVLDPIYGYLLLAQRMFDSPEFAAAWNFGPAPHESAPVSEIVDSLSQKWGDGATWELDRAAHPYENATLTLDASKARIQLGWSPQISLSAALSLTIEWYRALASGEDVGMVSQRQIENYLESAASVSGHLYASAPPFAEVERP